MVAPFLVNFPFLLSFLVILPSTVETFFFLFLQLIGIISVLVKPECMWPPVGLHRCHNNFATSGCWHQQCFFQWMMPWGFSVLRIQALFKLLIFPFLYFHVDSFLLQSATVTSFSLLCLHFAANTCFEKGKSVTIIVIQKYLQCAFSRTVESLDQ